MYASAATVPLTAKRSKDIQVLLSYLDMIILEI
jgi:hypothetical protein